MHAPSSSLPRRALIALRQHWQRRRMRAEAKTLDAQALRDLGLGRGELSYWMQQRY